MLRELSSAQRRKHDSAKLGQVARGVLRDGRPGPYAGIRHGDSATTTIVAAAGTRASAPALGSAKLPAEPPAPETDAHRDHSGTDCGKAIS
jgi:hypothetical protein